MAETHKEILERFESDYQHDRSNREDGIEDLNFVGGDQWDNRVRSQREMTGRPVITINNTGQFIRQVSGDLRQSMPAMEPVPVDDKTDPAMADVYSGIIRQIEYQNAAQTAYVWAAEQAISCGIGHWQYGTKYTDDDSFNQDITVDRIMDPFAVVWDAAAMKLNRSDAKCCFVTEWLTKTQYQKEFKTDEIPTDFPMTKTWNYSNLNWVRDDRVRIASYWYKVDKIKHIGLLNTGEVIDLDQIPRDVVQMLGLKAERKVQSYDVKHLKLSGVDILSEQSWAGRFIPVIPVIGNELCIEGQTMRYGVVRWMKDPARLYNYFRSASAEVIATQPKAPYLVPFESIQGLEAWWNRANVDNMPYLPYKLDEKFPNARPTREAPPQASAAMYQEAALAEQDKHSTTGIYPASLGKRSNETSGVAIEARQREGDTGSFVYFDNFNHAMQWGGTVLVDLIGKTYDGERVVRILGPDESEHLIPINKTVQNNGDPIIINDISAGKFDVRIKTGTSFASAREEAKAALAKLITAQPELMKVMGDLFFESMDFPGAKKIAARMKKTMDPALLGNDPGAQQPPPPDPVVEIIKKMQVEQLGANVKKTQTEAEKNRATTVKLLSEAHGNAIGNHSSLDQNAMDHMNHAHSLMAPVVEPVTEQAND